AASHSLVQRIQAGFFFQSVPLGFLAGINGLQKFSRIPFFFQVAVNGSVQFAQVVAQIFVLGLFGHGLQTVQVGVVEVDSPPREQGFAQGRVVLVAVGASKQTPGLVFGNLIVLTFF